MFKEHTGTGPNKAYILWFTRLVGKRLGMPGLPEVLIIETDFLIRRSHAL